MSLRSGPVVAVHSNSKSCFSAFFRLSPRNSFDTLQWSLTISLDTARASSKSPFQSESSQTPEFQAYQEEDESGVPRYSKWFGWWVYRRAVPKKQTLSEEIEQAVNEATATVLPAMDQQQSQNGTTPQTPSPSEEEDLDEEDEREEAEEGNKKDGVEESDPEEQHSAKATDPSLTTAQRRQTKKVRRQRRRERNVDHKLEEAKNRFWRAEARRQEKSVAVIPLRGWKILHRDAYLILWHREKTIGSESELVFREVMQHLKAPMLVECYDSDLRRIIRLAEVDFLKETGRHISVSP